GPRVPPVGRRRAALARAPARGGDLPAPPGKHLVAARAPAGGASGAVRGPRALRDAAREDAHPAGAAPARRRQPRGPPRHRRLARGIAMSGTLAWALGALGLSLVVVRRRSVAVGLVTVQALILVVYAADRAATTDDLVAACALGVRALALGALFMFLVARTREIRPVRARIAPLVRAGLAVTFALTLTWLIPTIGLGSRDAERAVLALVAFGIMTVATRRATLFQIIGIVLVENALALSALELPGG